MAYLRHITPRVPWRTYLRQLWQRRETLLMLTLKDMRVQYGRPWLGMLWAIGQPLVYGAAVMVAVGDPTGATESTALPYPVHLLAGLVMWTYLNGCVTGASQAVHGQSGLLQRSFFPRMYIVLSQVLRCTADLMLGLAVMMAVAAWFGVFPSENALWAIPCAVVAAVLSATGLAVLAAAAVTVSRHVRHAVPVLMLALMFVLPVIRPMPGAMEAFFPPAAAMALLRSSFNGAADASLAAAGIVGGALMTVVGLAAFKAMERRLDEGA